MHGHMDVKFKKPYLILLLNEYYSSDENKKAEMTEHVNSMRDKRLA
jgi:hypothetical protein